MGRVKRKKVKKKASPKRRRSVRLKAIPSRTKVKSRGLKHEKTTGDTFAAIKKSLSDIGGSLSEGADKVAGLLLENSQKDKGAKTRRLKKELVSMLEDVGSGIKRSLKKVKPKDVLCGASYEIGKLSRITRDACVKIFNGLME